MVSISDIRCFISHMVSSFASSTFQHYTPVHGDVWWLWDGGGGAAEACHGVHMCYVGHRLHMG